MKSLLLPPLSALYGALTKTRLSLYRRGTFKTIALERPVISVGNITTGGTGKTPLVEWVAKSLAQRGNKVCILTRGYGRFHPEQQVVVSDGQTVLATPEEAGDEPYLLAQKLAGLAAVISNADRLSAGRYAIETFGTDCFVLDDGFQHLRLARELDIVTIDATNPWGGGQLLPYGRLREPLAELSRADCVVITRCDQAGNLDALRAQIRRLMGERPLFTSRMRIAGVRSLSGAGEILDQPLAAFCAIGNPGSFFKQLREAGHKLVLEKAFRDHHYYTQQDIETLIAEATRAGAKSLITTDKDAVKLSPLSFSLPCHALEIEIEIANESELAAKMHTVIK